MATNLNFNAARFLSRRRERNRQPAMPYTEQRRRRISNFYAAQRRQRVFFLHLMFFLISSSITTERQVWSFDHPHQFWENAYTHYDDFQFLQNLRMTRSTFDYLCRLLKEDRQRQETNMTLPISVERQVGICLWLLGSNADYRTVAALFGVGRSTVCCILYRFVEALSKKSNDFIIFPHGEELNRVIRSYEMKWGFPNAGGAIDGSHIPILSPTENHGDYHNRKGWHSIVLQAVVNDRYEFTDINVGWPGSVHDARVYANSGIYAKGHNGILFEQKTVTVNTSQIPIVLLGDPAYPLSQFLLKPYTNNGHLTRQQKHFNYMLSRSRMTIENAFGRLKGRWRCLLKRLDVSTSIVPTVVTACCLLHNITEQAKDPFRIEWLEGVNNVNNDMPQPQVINQDDNVVGNCARIREIITEYFQ